MIIALITSSLYPQWIRLVGRINSAELFGNPSSGYIACASRNVNSRRELYVVTPSGNIKSKTFILKGQQLCGIDAQNQPIIRKAKLMRKDSVYFVFDDNSPEQYGDTRIVHHQADGYTLSGRTKANLKGSSLAISFAPLINTASVAYAESGYYSRIAVLSGAGLKTTKFVEPHLGATPRRDVTPLRIHSEDLSVASIGANEVCLYVETSDIPDYILEYIPQIGIHYIPPGNYRVFDRCLVVMSLITGECTFVTRILESGGHEFSIPRSKTLASLGKGKVLLSHDDQLLAIDVGPKNRIVCP